MKKTRSGKVVKVVKEHYLRDDIWCSVESCRACEHTETVLGAVPSINKAFSLPHYIIPDTNIFINQVWCLHIATEESSKSKGHLLNKHAARATLLTKFISISLSLSISRVCFCL